MRVRARTAVCARRAAMSAHLSPAEWAMQDGRQTRGRVRACGGLGARASAVREVKCEVGENGGVLPDVPFLPDGRAMLFNLRELQVTFNMNQSYPPHTPMPERWAGALSALTGLTDLTLAFGVRYLDAACICLCALEQPLSQPAS